MSRNEYGTLDESFVKTQDISRRENPVTEEQLVMETDDQVVLDHNKVAFDQEQRGEENETGDSSQLDHQQPTKERVSRKRQRGLTK